MAAQAGNKEREKEKAAKLRRRSWNLAQAIVGPWIRKKFNFSCDDFDPSSIEGPVLVAINHACAYDPIFVGAAFKNKPLTFIASEHLLRTKPWGPILDKHFSIIPHQKGARGSRTALVAMKRIKKGESIFLAVEGEQTWNGRPLPVMPYTGKLAKGSGATLVTYRIEGAYLSAPRWATGTRKGKVYGRPAGVYSPETLKGMSDEEVEQIIARDLGFDTWEWQRSQPGGPLKYKCTKGGNADGLERAVFTCPSCGAFGKLTSDGDSISCSCGFRVRLEDTGFFEQAAPFETTADWEKADLEALKKGIEEIENIGDNGGQTVLFEDDGITLYSIENGHEENVAAIGKLTLEYTVGGFWLCIGDREFKVAGISNMTMVLAGRVVFSDESGYYELRSGKGSRINLRKYVMARDFIKT